MSDPDKRKKYDSLGTDWQAYQQSGGNWEQYAQQQQSSRGGSGQAFYFDEDFFGNGDHSSFFDRFFGSSQEARDPFRRQGERAGSFKGRDLEAELPITLLEAYQGSKRIFVLNGKGMPQHKNPKVFGSLLVKLHVQLPKKLSEKERDLFLQLQKLHS